MELINSSKKDYLNNMLTKVRKAELLCALFLRGMESKKTKYGAGCGWNMRQYGLLALHQLMQSKLMQFLYHNTNMSNAMMSCGK